jgi:hypothetical protein
MELAWGDLEISGRPTLKTIAHDCDPEDHKLVLKTRPEHQLLYFFSFDEFFPTGFSRVRFLTRQQVGHKQSLWCDFFSYLIFQMGFWGSF